MKLSRILACLFGGIVLGITGFVIAGSGSIAILDGGSVSRTYAVTTDGSGFFMGRNTIWDSAAGANGAAVTASNALKVDNSAVTQPINVFQINGVTPLMGNGVSGTGAQRVTLASDSTGQVTLAAGAATIGSLAANQSTNEAQINGVAPSMGNGVSGTGVQRVTLASDGTGQVTLATGANTIGALTANQSVNFAQVNGVTTLTGNGVAGTGSTRITIASDNLAISGLGAAATAGAVPANAIYIGGQASAVLKGVTMCDTHAFYDASDNGRKTVVAGVSAKKIYVCGFLMATGGTATNLTLTSGTGTDCVTTSVAITPAYQMLANDKVGANSTFWNGLITLANADNLCVNASAGNAHQVEVWYTIQ